MPSCPICLDAGAEKFAALQCGHVFHRKCISAWLSTSAPARHCPLCSKPAGKLLDLYFDASPVKMNRPANKKNSDRLVEEKSTKRWPMPMPSKPLSKRISHQRTRQYELRSRSRSHRPPSRRLY